MSEIDATREAIQTLVEYSKMTSRVVTIQLIAAILMIGVEACLLWAILKLARYIVDLIKKMQYLTIKVEVILEKMGWQTTAKFMDNVAEGDDVDMATRKALLDAQREAGMAPEET